MRLPGTGPPTSRMVRRNTGKSSYRVFVRSRGALSSIEHLLERVQVLPAQSKGSSASFNRSAEERRPPRAQMSVSMISLDGPVAVDFGTRTRCNRQAAQSHGETACVRCRRAQSGLTCVDVELTCAQVCRLHRPLRTSRAITDRASARVVDRLTRENRASACGDRTNGHLVRECP